VVAVLVAAAVVLAAVAEVAQMVPPAAPAGYKVAEVAGPAVASLAEQGAAALSASFGPVTRAHSHQQTQETCKWQLFQASSLR
jgi:hypothetical protein